MRLLLVLAAASLIASCGKNASTWSSPSATPGPPGSGAVQVQWTPVAVPNQAGYRVYYGTASRNYLQPFGQGLASPASTVTVTGLARAKRYFFAVTTIDSLGNESAFSQEAFVDLP